MDIRAHCDKLGLVDQNPRSGEGLPIDPLQRCISEWNFLVFPAAKRATLGKKDYHENRPYAPLTKWGWRDLNPWGVKDEPVHYRQDPISAAFGNSAELNKR
jgi:hypothetical protein